MYFVGLCQLNFIVIRLRPTGCLGGGGRGAVFCILTRVGDAHGSNTVVFTTGGSKINVVARVMMDTGLG